MLSKEVEKYSLVQGENWVLCLMHTTAGLQHLLPKLTTTKKKQTGRLASPLPALAPDAFKHVGEWRHPRQALLGGARVVAVVDGAAAAADSGYPVLNVGCVGASMSIAQPGSTEAASD